MNYPKHIVATGSLIQNKNSQILLVKTERRGWEMPGGQVEEGEDIISALKREVLEEAGIDIQVLRLGALYSSVSEPCKMMVDFISEYTDGIPKADNEIIDAQWFSREEAILNIKSESMLYRIQWLLENDDNIRYASYSKNPFKVVSETIFAKTHKTQYR